MTGEETRVRDLETALATVLAIIDSPENQGAGVYAAVHGYTVDPAVSKRNGQAIEHAYALLGQTRPPG